MTVDSTPPVAPRTPLLVAVPSLPLPPLRLLPLAAPTSRGEYSSTGSRQRILSSRDRQVPVSTARVFSERATPNSDERDVAVLDAEASVPSISLPSPAIAALAATVTEALGGKGFHEGIISDGSPTLRSSILPLARTAVAHVREYSQRHLLAVPITPASLSQAATQVAMKAYDLSRTSADGVVSTVYPPLPEEQLASHVQQKAEELLHSTKEKDKRDNPVVATGVEANDPPPTPTVTAVTAMEATSAQPPTPTPTTGNTSMSPDSPARVVRRNTLMEQSLQSEPPKNKGCCVIL